MALHSTEPAQRGKLQVFMIFEICLARLSLVKYGNTRRYAEFEIDQTKIGK